MKEPVRTPRAWLRLLGVAVLALLGTALVSGIWAALLTLNLHSSTRWPWSALAMGALLALAWNYFAGHGWPRSGAAARARGLRANRIPSAFFADALIAGTLALIAIAGLWIVAFQTGLMQGNRLPDYSPYPWPMIVATLAMAAIVGGVSEEAAFRGYFQGALERLVSAPIAIGATALLLAPGHAATQGFALPTFVFYLVVDAMLGTIAYLANSILPGIVVHSIGLAIFFALIWPFDTARVAGVDALRDHWFWIHAGQVVLFSILALRAFRRLAARPRSQGDA